MRNDVEARRVDGVAKRQKFEEMVLRARASGRTNDYEDAISAAAAYVNVADGIVAMLLREEMAA